MNVFGICVADDDKFFRCVVPGLEQLADKDFSVIRTKHATSIFEAYNSILDSMAQHSGVEALVLMHEDVEIKDPDFCKKIKQEIVKPDIAVLGVVGARRIDCLKWWKGQCFGRVDETRGLIDFGGGSHDVEVVDGLLMVLSPWAIDNLRFDTKTFTGFHGYDADFCMQARQKNRRVGVFESKVFHHTKGGFGDKPAWDKANEAWIKKWINLSP